MKRDEGKQDLAFNSRQFVLCGLPIRRPPHGVLEYSRRNGKFFLNITGHPRFGLPFGQDRLIPIWVATLALRQGNRTIRFNTASEILQTFDLPRDGKTYRRLVEGFKLDFYMWLAWRCWTASGSLIGWVSCTRCGQAAQRCCRPTRSTF